MVNYPNGKKTYNKPLISSGNRGMDLEESINITNEYYRNNNIAIIYKKPTPIKLVKMDYEKAKIVEAYFQQPSTTDYNGVYKGYYIDFEAKETNNATSFPLANIHAHQIEHLKSVLEHKGIAFIIVSFRKKEEVYVLPAQIVIQFYEAGARKSIPYQTFVEQGFKIKEGYALRLDYLKIIDENFIKNFNK
ncbi:MAG: Holliday junction resolvase RecU [Erysipelotrichaceae bacterium]|nr:Holliday junction resolvase RecU [Erysipelotrichaceae bacterium]